MSLKSNYAKVFTSKRSKKTYKPIKKNFRKLLNSFTGFIYGILVTYGLYYLFTTQFYLNPLTAKWIFTILGVPLSFGCSVSPDLRCTIFLFLPHFFSKRGRTALLAYVFALSLTGPTKNIVLNMEVLGHSINCAEDELKEALNAILLIVKSPIIAIKQAITNVLHQIRKVIQRVKEVVMKIIKVLYHIIDSIRKAFKWLHKVVNVCNSKVGTPFQRCQSAFKEAFEECRTSPGSISWMCGTMDRAKFVCHGIKFLDHVCEFLLFIKEGVINQVTEGIKDYIDSVLKIFKVSVVIDHKYSFKTQASKSYKAIWSDILQDIDEQASKVLSFFKISITLGLVFFVWMFFKIERYRRKYLRNDRYNNIYITNNVIRIDQTFKILNREPLLPLKRHERLKYISLFSCRVAKSECYKLYKAFVMLSLSSVQILATLVIDYSLFWLLSQVRHYGRKIKPIQSSNLVTFDIKGNGILAELCEGIANSFNSFTRVYSIDTMPCLPNPVEPNYLLYKKILIILGLIWILLLLEPYGLRIRQKILEFYYPIRAEERAIWLYNEIMSDRRLFVQLARRKARQKYLKDKAGTYGYDFKLVRVWKKIVKCLTLIKYRCKLCGDSFTEYTMLVDCIQEGCKGQYCFDCFEKLNGTCPLCNDPVTYGDLSDYSEEYGTTDEDDYHVSRFLKDKIK